METTQKFSNLFQVAEIELIYKSKVKACDRIKIGSSKDACQIIRKSWDENKIEFIEQFKVLFLNRANQVLGIYELSSGGISGTVADPRIVFAAALKVNCCAIIITHNHPSGNLIPSKADEQLTQKIKNAGEFLDIKLMDHLIVTLEGYYSFADEGLL